jgi:hypothetical protein
LPDFTVCLLNDNKEMDYVYFLDDYKRDNVFISNMRIKKLVGEGAKDEVLLYVVFMDRNNSLF